MAGTDCNTNTSLDHSSASIGVDISNIPDAVVIADANTKRIVKANAAAGDLFNCSPRDLIGQSQTELHPAGETDEYVTAFRRGIEGERVNQLSDGSPLYIETADGTHTPVEINAQRIETDDCVLILGVFREVSERLERERELEATTTRLNALLDALPVPVAVTDTDGVVKRWNPASEATFGYSREEIIGRSHPLFIDDQEFTRLFERVMDGRGLDGYETTLRAADGSQTSVELYARPLYQDGVFSGAVSAAIDVSGRRRRERQLSVLHRVLRHNLRNDLNAIRGWATQLDATDETQQEAIARINSAVDRLVQVSADTTEIRRQLNRATDDPGSGSTISVPQAHTEIANGMSGYDSISIEVVSAPEWATVPRRGVDAIVELLGEFSGNLADAELTIDTYDMYARIRVMASDPILSPEQRSFIATGTETALNHLDSITVAKALLEIDSIGGSVTIPPGSSGTFALSIELPRTDN